MIALLFAVLPGISAAQTTSPEDYGAAALVKDETVYAVLGYDGAAGSVYIVNHIDTLKAGVYTDYGAYSEVSPLSAAV